MLLRGEIVWQKIPFFCCVLVLCGVAIFAQNQEAPMKPDNPLPQTRIGEDGVEMVLIHAGEFLMGTQEGAIEQLVAEFAQYNMRPKIQRHWFVDEIPQHRIYLDAYCTILSSKYPKPRSTL